MVRREHGIECVTKSRVLFSIGCQQVTPTSSPKLSSCLRTLWALRFLVALLIQFFGALSHDFSDATVFRLPQPKSQAISTKYVNPCLLNIPSGLCGSGAYVDLRLGKSNTSLEKLPELLLNRLGATGERVSDASPKEGSPLLLGSSELNRLADISHQAEDWSLWGTDQKENWRN